MSSGTLPLLLLLPGLGGGVTTFRRSDASPPSSNDAFSSLGLTFKFLLRLFLVGRGLALPTTPMPGCRAEERFTIPAPKLITNPPFELIFI